MPLKISGTFYTIEEAKRLLGVSRQTLWKAIKRGDLPAIEYAYRVFIREEDLFEWKAKHYRADKALRRKKKLRDRKNKAGT